MISLPVTEASQVGAARRRAVQEGAAVGLSQDACDRLALIVTEAGTNLVRHAREGEIILARHEEGQGRGIDVIAVDSGPGVGDVAAALTDGYTTAVAGERGIGGGLGAIRRLSDVFDLHSDAKGTTVLAAVAEGPSPIAQPTEAAGLIVCKPGFEQGGDAHAMRSEDDATLLLLMDVLGHGPAAASEAVRGITAFRKAAGRSLEETEALVSVGLEGGRGAATLLIELPHGPGRLRAVGLGNVKGEIVRANGERFGIPSTPGIAGNTTRRPRPTEHDWPAGATLILSTDGLRSAGRDPDPAALFSRLPLTVAATLYKRRRRGTDDSGVLVARGPL
ncbi:ATP-binding protein [Mangrovicella endophytica]|uniref:ATP-binding protein n=1 Tax=Mangrovicella endophytica TaxID=2066697 RepID=UPI000C9E4AE8|nr:ATP-binding protein [Mangrovicella endophytica]